MSHHSQIDSSNRSLASETLFGNANRPNNDSLSNLYTFANIQSSASISTSSMNHTLSRNSEIPVASTYEFQSSLIHDSASDSRDDVKKYKVASRIFFATSVGSALLVLVFEVYMYAVINIHKKKLKSEERYIEISIYLSLFIFAAIYQIMLTMIGLRTKNMLLLAMLCFFYACMLIYTGIQYQEISNTLGSSLERNWKTATKATNIATIAILGVTLIIQVYMIFFVLRQNVKWFRYKKIGADLRIKKMYNIFQFHRCLLIFDFFFFLGFTVQFIVIMVAKKNSVEFILTVCMLPLTLIVLILSDFATTREIKQLTIITTMSFGGGCAYVLFKIVRLYTKYSSAFNIGVVPGAYFPGRKSLVTFGILTLILLFTTIVVEMIMLINYGSGLLPLVSTSYRWLPGYSKSHLEQSDANISMDMLDLQQLDSFNNSKLEID